MHFHYMCVFCAYAYNVRNSVTAASGAAFVVVLVLIILIDGRVFVALSFARARLSLHTHDEASALYAWCGE